MCEWINTNSPFPQECNPFWHTTLAVMWSGVMIVSEVRLHPMRSTVYSVKWLPPCAFFSQRSAIYTWAVWRKAFIGECCSVKETFSKYNTSFIISGHGGKSWRQSSKMTYPPNASSFVSDKTFRDCLEPTFFLVYCPTDMLLRGNSLNPSFSSKLSYCFQFHSCLAIFCLWHRRFSSECQSRWQILVSC